MRFLHTADWHLAPDGASAAEREMERESICQAIPELLIRESIPLIAIAGDVLQRTDGESAEALQLLEEALRTYIWDCAASVILVAGNHDMKLRLSPAVLSLPNLHFISLHDYRLRPIHFQDQYGPVYCYGLPYLFPEIVCGDGFKEVKTHHDAYNRLLVSMKRPEQGVRRVMITHCMVLTGCAEDPRTKRYQYSGEKVFADVFAPFDYTALGHLHSTEAVTGRIRYAPCPIPRGREPEDGMISIVEMDRDDVQVENRRICFMKGRRENEVSL